MDRTENRPASKYIYGRVVEQIDGKHGQLTEADIEAAHAIDVISNYWRGNAPPRKKWTKKVKGQSQ